MADKVKLVSSTRIYMDVRALLDDVLDVTVNFPKLYKYSVGARMQNLTVDLMQDVASAYMNKDKELRIQYLVNFQTKFETLRTLMRIAGERRWIKGHYEVLAIKNKYKPIYRIKKELSNGNRRTDRITH